MRTWSITNQKGGVGKTSTTIELGAALAELGHRVLLVDLDPQGHLTECLGIPEAPDDRTLAKRMLDGGDLIPTIVTHSAGIDVVPTNVDAFLLERDLLRERAQEVRLDRVLGPLRRSYDFCLIDCPPSLGVLTDNALVAARHRPQPSESGGIVIPVQAEDSTLRALRLLLLQVRSAEQGLQVGLDVIGMVVNAFDQRRGQVVTTSLKALEEMPIPILGVIGDRVAVKETWRYRAPVLTHSPSSDAAAMYRDLARATLKAAEERSS